MGFSSWQHYCTAFSSGRQPNFAALNRGRHLCSAGWPSGWALAHILVLYLFLYYTDRVLLQNRLSWYGRVFRKDENVWVKNAWIMKWNVWYLEEAGQRKPGVRLQPKTWTWQLNENTVDCSTTATISRPFFGDHLGELVPEENFWTLWCKGRLTEADTLTIWLGATPSELTN